ncbi:PEP-CTERM sorting domain-containing protein [Pseudoduganella umbonata]|nr:PEP-CTERM sorting domain-containing protein [Pseudoduganella umbonata]MBB3221442.1 hypothetical protein [Pseudoduganella umbonata]
MKLLAQKLAAATAVLAFAFNAHAAIGSASAADVTLDGQAADAFAYEAGWNPHAGPNGDTSGFGTAFDAFGTGDFDLLAKYESAGFPDTSPLTFTFEQAPGGTSGTWSVTNTGSDIITLDLVFAIHAGNQGGAWLFDDQTINPGETETLPGTWEILWTVGNNGANPEFSNLTLFERDRVTSPIPEPETYAMLLAGLGVTVLARRRRKS